jgi:transposase
MDEFSIQKGHRYATVVIDWQTGEILFLERGNTLYQLIHFFDKMGKSWMKKVQALSMDMNTQYAAAVKARYTNIAIVYDGFHIVKNFNDRILTELRRLEQNRLKEEAKTHKSIKNLRTKKRKALANEQKTIDDAIFENQEYLKEIKRKYKELKNTRFLITSSRKALTQKDIMAKKHNRHLYEKYEKKGLKIPENEHKWSIVNVKKLDNVLTCNENLAIAYFLGDQLKAGLDSINEDEMSRGLEKWLELSKSFEKTIPMLKTFNKMIETRIEGILSRVKYPISNGPLEGLNNMIKVTKRIAYGYRDDEYFFYKLFDKSRQNIKSRTLNAALKSRVLKNTVP